MLVVFVYAILFLFLLPLCVGSVLGVPQPVGCSPPCILIHNTWFRSLGSSAHSSMCGRCLCVIPFPQTSFSMVEVATYTGFDNRVARTKRNKEMRRKRVCMRLGEAEDETMCNDPSIYMLDDCASEESSGGIASCLLRAR